MFLDIRNPKLSERPFRCWLCDGALFLFSMRWTIPLAAEAGRARMSSREREKERGVYG